MTRRNIIPGVLDMAALAALTGVTPMRDRHDYRREVRRLHRAGQSEKAIAAALSLSVGLVRELLSDRLL